MTTPGKSYLLAISITVLDALLTVRIKRPWAGGAIDDVVRLHAQTLLDVATDDEADLYLEMLDAVGSDRGFCNSVSEERVRALQALATEVVEAQNKLRGVIEAGDPLAARKTANVAH